MITLGIDTAARVLLPLAQRSNWSRLGDRFSGHHLRLQPEDIVGGVVLVVSGALLVWGLSFALKMSKRLDRSTKPRAVLDLLGAAHGVTTAERRQLKQVAERANLASAAELFVRPEVFRRESGSAKLAERLFGESHPTANGPSHGSRNR